MGVYKSFLYTLLLKNILIFVIYMAHMYIYDSSKICILRILTYVTIYCVTRFFRWEFVFALFASDVESAKNIK